MADSSKIPIKKRIEGKIRNFESILTIVTDECTRGVMVERIAQLKRQLSSLKGDE